MSVVGLVVIGGCVCIIVSVEGLDVYECVVVLCMEVVV